MEILDIKTTTQEIELFNPKDNSPLGIFIEILPFDNDKVKQAERNYIKALQKSAQLGEVLNGKDADELAIDKTCDCISGWRWEADEDRGVEQPLMNGEIPKFTQANVRKLMSMVWFRGQVEAARGNERDFFTS